MQVVVTGAAGFIGSHLAERLARDGHHVVGIDNFAPFYDRSQKRRNAERLANLGITIHAADLVTDPLAPILSDVDALFHLAAQPGLSPSTTPEAFTRNNVRATERVVAHLDDHPTLRAFVYASSSSVYGADATVAEDGPLAPTSIYGETKLEGERIIDAASDHASWDACTLRLFSVYGPRERPDKLIPKAARCAIKCEPFPLFRGSEHHRRSFTYVGDAVDGLVAALDRFDQCAGETINVGTPRSVSTMEVLRCITDVVGRRLCIDRLPPREGDQQRTEARIDRARRLLDFEPRTSLLEGIRAEVDWILQVLDPRTVTPCGLS